MANRAYLFPANLADVWDRPEGNYYDSRWVIPLAWFFFYRPGDIQMVDVQFRESKWQEIKFAADMVAAADLFSRRRPLLSSIIENQVDENEVTQLLARLAAWPGQFLLLDPGEVLAGMKQSEAWHTERCARILSMLDSDRPEPRAVMEAIYPYVGNFHPDADRRLGQVVGYTYW
ncbi:MAG TPA: hypothetical protein VGX70_21690 [Gemmataceae bacterium]|nr:hypothetical protein [Gemmataceae bacterium]